MNGVWGLILISISIIYSVLFAYYYKNKFSLIDSKLEKLDEMLSSADDMIDELNNISDYVTTNLEQSNARLLKTQNDVKDTVQASVNNINDLLDVIDHKTAYCNEVIQKALAVQQKVVQQKTPHSGRKNSIPEKASPPKDEHSKKAQAIKMANDGADIRTIAKTLKIGQGEVELFLIKN